MVKNKPVVTLSDAFKDWQTQGGIFAKMVTVADLPWETAVNASLLDFDFMGNHSGQKKCSPLLYEMMDDNHEIGTTGITFLASLVTAKFLPNWTALWNTYHAQYNPLEDYNVTETGSNTDIFSGTKSGSKNGTNTGTDTNQLVHGEVIATSGTDNKSLVHGHTIGTQESESASEVDGKFGFNTTENSVPTDTKEITRTSGKTESHSGIDQDNRTVNLSDTHSGTDTDTRTLNLANSETTSGSESSRDEGRYQKNRAGRTGGRSAQDMILQERELWLEDYFTRIYSDLDSVLTLPIYNREHEMKYPYVYSLGYYAI